MVAGASLHIEVESSGANAEEIARDLSEGIDLTAFWTDAFTALQEIFRFRFESGQYTQKQRPHVYGFETFSQTSTDRFGAITPKQSRFKPSLTEDHHYLGIREIEGPSRASFGTMFPWAMLLHTGGVVSRMRVTYPTSGRQKVKWSPSPGITRTARMTQDSMAIYPERPILKPLQPIELEAFNRAMEAFWQTEWDNITSQWNNGGYISFTGFHVG